MDREVEDFLDRCNFYLESYYLNEKKENILVDFTTVFVSGSVYWAKVVGKPVNNYEGDAKEWTFDFVPDDVTFLKEHKLLDRLKEARDPIPGDYLRLKKPELDSEGNKNDPIEIIDSEDNPWDDRLIGNGSRVDLKLTVADWGKGKFKSIWTKAIRVTDLVEYKASAFASMNKDGPDRVVAAPTKTVKKAFSKTVLDELDDDELPPFGE